METLQTIHDRRSVRNFTDKMVPEETLNKILEAATWAPSGMGRQSVTLVCVTDRQDRDALSAMNAAIMGKTDFDPFYGCPTVVVVLAKKDMPTHVYDGSLMAGTLMLAAADCGVDSIWIHRAKEEFDSPQGKDLLKKWGLEGDYEGICHVLLGYGQGAKSAGAPRRPDAILRV
jgi:nitroreductase